jgi:hypothetical protein
MQGTDIGENVESGGWFFFSEIVYNFSTALVYC